MNPVIFLYIIRIVSALLLLSFVSVIAWLIYKEMRVTEASLLAAGNPQGQLRVVANEGTLPLVDALFSLSPVTSLGRANGNTIVLPDDGYASGQHALLVWRNGRWWVEDLGSRNGTLLNDVAVVDTAVLSSGDIIAIGGTQFRVEF